MATKLSMMRTFTRASLSGQAKPKADASSYVDELEVEIDTARGLLLPVGAAHLAADVLSLVCLVPLVTIHGPAVAAALGCREHADFEAAADEDEGGEVRADAWCDAHGGIHAYAALAEAGPAETLVHLLAATVCLLLVQVSARPAGAPRRAGLSLPVCCLVAYRRATTRGWCGASRSASARARSRRRRCPERSRIVALDPPRCACGSSRRCSRSRSPRPAGAYVLAWLAPEFDDDGAGAAARRRVAPPWSSPPSDSATLVCAVALFCLAAARIAVPPAAATLAAAWRVVARCLGGSGAAGVRRDGRRPLHEHGRRLPRGRRRKAAYAAEQAAAEADAPPPPSGRPRKREEEGASREGRRGRAARRREEGREEGEGGGGGGGEGERAHRVDGGVRGRTRVRLACARVAPLAKLAGIGPSIYGVVADQADGRPTRRPRGRRGQVLAR